MEIFKSNELKKEFKRFEEQDLTKILECGYCQKTACQSFHAKFLVTCKFSRETFCKNCHKFDVLLEKADEIGKDYIENFIRDFLNTSTKITKLSYKVQIESVPVEKTF